MSLTYKQQIQDSVEPSAEMIAFVERQVRDALPYVGTEKRSEHRNLMVLPVVAQALDDDFHAIDEPFPVVTRDLSPQGVGFVHTDRFDYDRLALQFTIANEKVMVVAEVEWQRDMGPFYFSGARIVAKLDTFPS